MAMLVITRGYKKCQASNSWNQFWPKRMNHWNLQFVESSFCKANFIGWWTRTSKLDFPKLDNYLKQLTWYIYLYIYIYDDTLSKLPWYLWCHGPPIGLPSRDRRRLWCPARVPQEVRQPHPARPGAHGQPGGTRQSGGDSEGVKDGEGVEEVDLGLNIAGWWFGMVWNMNFMTFHILGMSSSQLTNSYFSEG